MLVFCLLLELKVPVCSGLLSLSAQIRTIVSLLLVANMVQSGDTQFTLSVILTCVNFCLHELYVKVLTHKNVEISMAICLSVKAVLLLLRLLLCVASCFVICIFFFSHNTAFAVSKFIKSLMYI